MKEMERTGRRKVISALIEYEDMRHLNSDIHRLYFNQLLRSHIPLYSHKQ